MCAQNHALGTRTRFQLEILTINGIFGIVYFREIILKSSRNISDTTPRPLPEPMLTFNWGGEVLWHSSESNFTESAQATILYNEFENCTCTSKIISTPLKGEWAKPRTYHSPWAVSCPVPSTVWECGCRPRGSLTHRMHSSCKGRMEDKDITLQKKPFIGYSVRSRSKEVKLRAKSFRGYINIHLHFVSFLHIDMTQVP